MRLHDQKAFSLALSLLVMTVLMGFGAIFVLRTVNEWNVVSHQRRTAEALHLANAGADSGLNTLDEMINSHLMSFISGQNPQLVIKKAKQTVGKTNGGITFLYWAAKKFDTQTNDYESVFLINEDENLLTYSLTNAQTLGNGSLRFDIYITEKAVPRLVSDDMWEFAYYYKITASGMSKGHDQDVVLEGDFNVSVRRDNFAKYALFTDHHRMPDGTSVWFTDSTYFAGPLHTNDGMRFARNPGGIFGGKVTQHNKKAKFYNNGWPVARDADAWDANGDGDLNDANDDVPVFNETFERGYDEIVLASSVQKEDLIDQALVQKSTPPNGVYIPYDSESELTGGIYVRGDATIEMGVDTSDRAYYTVHETNEKKVVKVDRVNNRTIVWTPNNPENDPSNINSLCEQIGEDQETGQCASYKGVPDGVDDIGTLIYVDGAITSLGGTIQKDTQITVSCENDAVITDHIQYSDYNAAVGTLGEDGYVPPNADDKTNLLGIVAWGGDVRIAKYKPDGTRVPDDINIHGVIMARNGVFQVDGYDDYAGSRGTATLLGGTITQFYGAFGLFNGSTGEQVSGYGRNFVYDNRMVSGVAPPYFPSMRTFIGFTNDLTNKIIYREGDV
ncbi:MAG: DUF4900 domain-containing protein [Candidatus Omnitrophota bacterium]